MPVFNNGEMAERLNAAASKAVVRVFLDRGFESPSLRHPELLKNFQNDTP